MLSMQRWRPPPPPLYPSIYFNVGFVIHAPFTKIMLLASLWGKYMILMATMAIIVATW